MHGSGLKNAFERSFSPETKADPLSNRSGAKEAVEPGLTGKSWPDRTAINQSMYADGLFLCDDVAARIRDQALEEAARIADQVAAGRDNMFHGIAVLGALIAEGIRSQKQCSRSDVLRLSSQSIDV
jgi:hypothetical protein